MDLLPGLPNDIARECLIRVSFKQFVAISSVCREWKSEIELPEFRLRRKATCHGQKLIVMAQNRVDPNRKSGGMKFSATPPVYRLTLLETGTGKWCDLPPIPGFCNGLPLFCQLAAVGSDLVVMGGLDPVTWEVSNSVFVFNFLSATWRRGADMPGVRRSFFGCASDQDRTVYVAGGHDGEKNALRSVISYDVAKNEWFSLPDMARERDECKGIFHRGKFHVIGGYCTEMQGRFERSAEAFDITTGRWDDLQEDFLEVNKCPRTCTRGNDEDLYMCHDGDVVALKSTAWQPVAKLPAEVCNATYMMMWQEKMLVIGSERFGESHVAYALDLKNYTWTKLETPKENSGHVQSGCYVEI